MSIYKLKGTSGSVINQSFPFGESILLGSAAACDVQVDELDVSAKHAQISLVDNDSLLLKDLDSKSGTRLNGESISESMLASGDEIHIGCPHVIHHLQDLLAFFAQPDHNSRFCEHFRIDFLDLLQQSN